jgi:hypothetical protein
MSDVQLVAPEAGMGLVLALGPEAGRPGDGGEIVVEGHFDDPAAADCTYGDEAARSLLDCRAQFAVTSPGGYVKP